MRVRKPRSGDYTLRVGGATLLCERAQSPEEQAENRRNTPGKGMSEEEWRDEKRRSVVRIGIKQLECGGTRQLGCGEQCSCRG